MIESLKNLIVGILTLGIFIGLGYLIIGYALGFAILMVACFLILSFAVGAVVRGVWND